MLLLISAGCESVAVNGKPSAEIDSSANKFSAYATYAAADVDIMPLTEFVTTEAGAKIKVYISLLDSFGCQIKTPAVFRFELYRKVLRCAEPKGKRIIIWLDTDLTDAAENNNHWRDFLRAYEFDLDFHPQGNHSYVLQVTCLCPDGKRLSDELVLSCN